MKNKNKFKILSFAVFFLINIFNQVHSLQEFGFVLKSKVTQCFTEKVSKDNFFKIEINTEIHMVKVEYAPPGEHKFGENNVNSFKKSFTAKEDGEFLFCVTSITNNDQKVYLKFALGVSAKDFSEIIKESDLKPINDKIEVIEKKVWDFKISAHHAEENQKDYMSLKEELGGFINFWFMLSCGIMLVIGLVGFFYTKFSYGTYKIK